MVRIASHPNGVPVVEGTQVSALAILLCFLAGSDEAEIRSKFPGLPSGALSAVLRWNAAGRPLPDTSEAPGILHRPIPVGEPTPDRDRLEED